MYDDLQVGQCDLAPLPSVDELMLNMDQQCVYQQSVVAFDGADAEEGGMIEDAGKQLFLDGTVLKEESLTSGDSRCTPSPPSFRAPRTLDTSPSRLQKNRDIPPKPLALKKVHSVLSFVSKQPAESDAKAARARAKQRLLQKRANRTPDGGVRYDVRRRIASSRPRVHGRFVKVD